MRTLQQAIRWGMSLSKFNSKIDYYTVLNLSAAASPMQIKKAFKELAKKYHPDVAKGN
jgi:DnaJ-class molecular chaperone